MTLPSKDKSYRPRESSYLFWNTKVALISLTVRAILVVVRLRDAELRVNIVEFTGRIPSSTTFDRCFVNVAVNFHASARR